jgi:hypothetical protein
MNSLLVYLLIFISGGLRSMQSANQYLVVVFIISLAAWAVLSDRKLNERFLVYLVIFTAFLFSISLYTNGSLSVASVIASTMKLLLTYLIIRTVGARFVDVFVNVVVFLATISLFGYLSDTLHLFEGIVQKLPPVGIFGYEGIFYVFRHIWHPYRNNSIFYEPGAYEGFLNAAFFLIVFVKKNLGNWARWTFITLLITALITAFSTTGFVIFAIGFLLFLYRSEILSFSGKLMLVVSIIATALIFASQFHSTLVVKLSDYLNPQEQLRGYSSSVRRYDTKTDLKLIKKHIFGMGFDKYKEEFTSIMGTEGMPMEKGGTAELSSSNGVTTIMAIYGIPFAIFIFGSHYWAFRKLLSDTLLANTAFVMFILFLWGESYYSISPISFSIIAGAFVLDRVSDRETRYQGAGIDPDARDRT